MLSDGKLNYWFTMGLFSMVWIGWILNSCIFLRKIACLSLRISFWGHVYQRLFQLCVDQDGKNLPHYKFTSITLQICEKKSAFFLVPYWCSIGGICPKQWLQWSGCWKGQLGIRESRGSGNLRIHKASIYGFVFPQRMVKVKQTLTFYYSHNNKLKKIKVL